MSKSLYIIIAVLLLGASAWFFFPSLKVFEIPESSNSETSKPSNIEMLTYRNSDYGFSFLYPSGFNVVELPGEEGSDVYVLQKSGTNEGFQLVITPFDEEGPITPARIKEDIPDMVIEDSKEVVLGSRTSNGSPTSAGFRALIFLSDDPSLGKTREVWFIQKGFLYQITAYADQDVFLGPILDMWKFL